MALGAGSKLIGHSRPEDELAPAITVVGVVGSAGRSANDLGRLPQHHRHGVLVKSGDGGPDQWSDGLRVTERQGS
jgi:hypothetical protein